MGEGVRKPGAGKEKAGKQGPPLGAHNKAVRAAFDPKKKPRPATIDVDKALAKAGKKPTIVDGQTDSVKHHAAVIDGNVYVRKGGTSPEWVQLPDKLSADKLPNPSGVTADPNMSMTTYKEVERQVRHAFPTTVPPGEVAALKQRIATQKPREVVDEYAGTISYSLPDGIYTQRLPELGDPFWYKLGIEEQ